MRETEDFTDYQYSAADGWVEWDKGTPPAGVTGRVDYRDYGRVNGYFTADVDDINWKWVAAYRAPSWGTAP